MHLPKIEYLSLNSIEEEIGEIPQIDFLEVTQEVESENEYYSDIGS